MRDQHQFRLPHLTRAVAAAVALTALVVISCSTAAAHQVVHEITPAPATVITLRYAGGPPFAFEAYELFAVGDSIPIQVGRSNAAGQIAFVPPHAGRWRLRAFAHDGHGLDLTFAAGAADSIPARESLPAAPNASLTRGMRILIALSLLFGLFGIISLFYRSRR